MNGATKTFLTPAKRWLLQRMQRIHFGRIYNLEFHNGEPVPTAQPSGKCKYKFGGANGAHPKSDLEDFEIRQSVLELFAYMERKQHGVIPLLVIQNGLPDTMELDEEP